jgi:hypothetical protein
MEFLVAEFCAFLAPLGLGLEGIRRNPCDPHQAASQSSRNSVDRNFPCCFEGCHSLSLLFCFSVMDQLIFHQILKITQPFLFYRLRTLWPRKHDCLHAQLDVSFLWSLCPFCLVMPVCMCVCVCVCVYVCVCKREREWERDLFIQRLIEYFMEEREKARGSSGIFLLLTILQPRSFDYFDRKLSLELPISSVN